LTSPDAAKPWNRSSSAAPLPKPENACPANSRTLLQLAKTARLAEHCPACPKTCPAKNCPACRKMAQLAENSRPNAVPRPPRNESGQVHPTARSRYLDRHACPAIVSAP
jgi:hypothetical protein